MSHLALVSLERRGPGERHVTTVAVDAGPVPTAVEDALGCKVLELRYFVANERGRGLEVDGALHVVV